MEVKDASGRVTVVPGFFKSCMCEIWGGEHFPVCVIVDRIVGLTSMSLANKNSWEMVLWPPRLLTANKMSDGYSRAR